MNAIDIEIAPQYQNTHLETVETYLSWAIEALRDCMEGKPLGIVSRGVIWEIIEEAEVLLAEVGSLRDIQTQLGPKAPAGIDPAISYLEDALDALHFGAEDDNEGPED